MDYLESEYGIKTELVRVVLNTKEQYVQASISKALIIVDKYFSYWARTNAVVATNRLSSAKLSLVNFLAAIRTQENRMEHTCAVIYQTTLKELVQCLRKPRTKKDDPQGERLRSEVRADRGDLKRYLKEIVSTLADSCREMPNDDILKKFLSLTREQMAKWCEGKVIEIEEIPVDDDITVEEYEIKPEMSDAAKMQYS